MNKVFYRGYEAQVMCEVENDNVCIKLLKSLYPEDLHNCEVYKLGAVFKVPKASTEPLCSTFNIGDKVKTIFSTPLVGYVVCYELWNNLIIVCSEKLNNYKDKRVRYAYALSELAKCDRIIELKSGSFYKLKGIVCMAVQDYDGTFMLISKQGSIINSKVPKEINLDLRDIQEVGSW